MVAEPSVFTVKPIGFVRNKIKETGHHDNDRIISEIVVNDDLTDALDNLDEFSHIIVLYWMHRAPKPFPMKVHPRRDSAIPEKGVFSSRSPSRPNPIGKDTVPLLERRGNILKVQGLEAIDGTPVIDIKPYIPGHDSVDDAKAPPWIRHHQRKL
ncbi:MAG: tRNA (N6-threonylcarbamoyladenosine(37)-N6)-methyltransferase TrmO [Dehalococcoidales bacterium]|nr:tRNA (N6-threonylcarbamoyladenosine(37)-N6)-methyltransferase TrmO [Dehalococcoidales bacterium]